MRRTGECIDMGCVWTGGCVDRRVHRGCVDRWVYTPFKTATEAGSTHPTGMHTYFIYVHYDTGMSRNKKLHRSFKLNLGFG